jgi:hypothetical protein
MKRIRSLFGGGGDEPRPGSAAPDSAAEPAEPAEDDDARDLRLQREFYTGLSDVARHELQFQGYAPQAPAQMNRTGRWFTSDETEARDASGRGIDLAAETALDYVGMQGDAESGLTFQFRTADGAQVEVAGAPGEEWPASIVRSSRLGTAGDA